MAKICYIRLITASLHPIAEVEIYAGLNK